MQRRPHLLARGATRADVIAVMTLIVLGLLFVGLRSAAGRPDLPTARAVYCTANLMRLGTAVAQCRVEHNGFGPTYDDGVASGSSGIMLTWADLLFDLDYLSTPSYQRCPDDAHPDPVTRERGSDWAFNFIDTFHVNAAPRPGVRTGYAMNTVASYNWREDEYSEPQRQIYALDGWWTFTMCLNAAWLYYEEGTGNPPPDPVTWPTVFGTMDGWRHGAAHSANALFFDGGVRTITPLIPHNVNELLNQTVDTEATCTWLPGEQNIRDDNERYRGTHSEWLGRLPKFAGAGGQRIINPALPPELDLDWRSAHNAWIHLPNPGDRR